MGVKYKGFDSLKFDKTGSFLLTDIELVKRDLLNHIFTTRGERIMMPNYGTIIKQLVFSSIDQNLLDAIHSELESVFDADPRVEIVDLQVSAMIDQKVVTVSAILRYNELNVVDSLDFDIDL